MVYGTILIPQNDVIVCQADKRQGDFYGKQSKRTKAQVPILFVWCRVISGFRGRVI